MLSKKTKYGLKALSYLASQEDRQPVQIAEIAKHENISQKFLESILLTLSKSGLLGSKKGKGGGYYLIKESRGYFNDRCNAYSRRPYCYGSLCESEFL